MRQKETSEETPEHLLRHARDTLTQAGRKDGLDAGPTGTVREGAPAGHRAGAAGSKPRHTPSLLETEQRKTHISHNPVRAWTVADKEA